MTQSQSDQLIYAGFWVRMGATVVDSILVVVVAGPVFMLAGGGEYLAQVRDCFDRALRGVPYTPPSGGLDLLTPVLAAATVAFWIYRSATPGKSLFSSRIVDARTGGAPSSGQCIVRYLGYFASLLGLGLGFLQIGLHPRKQGWHDMIAGTVVVRPSRNGGRPATFQAES